MADGCWNWLQLVRGPLVFLEKQNIQSKCFSGLTRHHRCIRFVIHIAYYSIICLLITRRVLIMCCFFMRSSTENNHIIFFTLTSKYHRNNWVFFSLFWWLWWSDCSGDGGVIESEAFTRVTQKMIYNSCNKSKIAPLHQIFVGFRICYIHTLLTRKQTKKWKRG
jgi:hypothetical protein